MSTLGTLLVLVGLAYLLGSIPFGKLVGKRHGVDIQKTGSGNIGFANVWRSLGIRPAFIVLAGDVTKGFIPVFVAKHNLTTWQVLTVAVIAILGHIFPVWLKFKGGKGIATGAGITLALNPLLGILGFVIYLAVIAVVRKSAAASITAAWSLPLVCLVLAPQYSVFYLGLALLATWTHRNNIKQMVENYHHAH